VDNDTKCDHSRLSDLAITEASWMRTYEHISILSFTYVRAWVSSEVWQGLSWVTYPLRMRKTQVYKCW